MVVCSACSTENDDDARFCKSCGASLAGLPGGREQRKTVTAVFCDVVGSTTLGESRDPEAVRALLARYFDRMRSIVEAHGGTVQKFIGDAVVAIFGVPIVHEDDALRALRAAAEMRDALPELEVDARFGVNTGEVVTSGDDTLVTGDAANVAARLQQAASPGEVLIGEPTRRLARDAIVVEELEPLDLKGKQDPVAVFRLVSVQPDAPGVARRFDVPLVGRTDELALLRVAYSNSVKRQGAVLFTLLGVAGVGKSRLVREFLAGLDARVVMGRCPSYGEGISYRPVVEVLEQLGGADDHLLAGSPGAADTLRALLGESDATTTPEEIDWAMRKLLDAAALERPLIVMFDDIHWGAPPFLDFVEHVADLSRTAPILLLCMARPELLETRPHWGGGKLNSTTVLLEPLDASESGALIGELLGGKQLEADVDERIRQVAGGNPLYLGEMLALVKESGRTDVTVPPTIQALLAARLDQLPPDERSVLERGSIEGHLFHTAAVQALDAGAPVEAELAALVRKDLIRPDSPQLAAFEAYRFSHLLIRDSAYDALPKATRAELHERFADWLDENAPNLVERDEFLGYHLEQAYRYRSELHPLDAEARALGERAAAHLAAAGRRAIDRGDVHAAASLLGRALEVGIAEPRERAYLQVELTNALWRTGRRLEADAVMAKAIEAANTLGERGLAAHAVAVHAFRHNADKEYGLDAAVDAAEAAIQVCSELGDTRGLAVAWSLLGLGLHFQGRLRDTSYNERALEFAEASGDRAARRSAISSLCADLHRLPIPVGVAMARAELLLDAAGDDRVLEARVKEKLALLYAMAGRSEEALVLLREGSEVLDELDDHADRGTWTNRAWARELAGDRVGAEKELTETISYFTKLGGGSQAQAALASLYCDDGRWEEAAALVTHFRELPLPHSPLVAADRLAVEARVAAHHGDLGEAIAVAERAVALVDTTQNPNRRANARLALAEVYRAAGRAADAHAATAGALELYELKGNVAAAARVRARALSS
jgi:class 3 adenylate cyclase/tetratricopeptide (TPR) repeat protein